MKKITSAVALIFSAFTFASAEPNVVQMMTRDYWISIASSGEKSLYTVKDINTKKTLVNRLSKKEFQAQKPDLFKKVNEAIAANQGKNGAVLDGRVDKQLYEKKKEL